MCEGKPVALGTVVKHGARVVIITKASELSGRITVARNGQTATASVIHQSREHDLAMLQFEARWARPLSFSPPAKATTGSLTVSVLSRTTDNKLGIVGSLSRDIPRQPGAMGLIVDELEVTTVQPSSAAKLAGVRIHDLLLSLNGVKLKSDHQIGEVLADLDAGDRLSLSLQRSGDIKSLSLQLLHRADRRFDTDIFQFGTAGASSLRRSGFATVLQHDSDLRPNQCGGPVLDLTGQLVGINIAKTGREAVYLLPTTSIRDFISGAKPSD